MALTERQKALVAAAARRCRARKKRNEAIYRITANERTFDWLEGSGLWRGSDPKDPEIERVLTAVVDQLAQEWLARNA